MLLRQWNGIFSLRDPSIFLKYFTGIYIKSHLFFGWTKYPLSLLWFYFGSFIKTLSHSTHPFTLPLPTFVGPFSGELGIIRSCRIPVVPNMPSSMRDSCHFVSFLVSWQWGVLPRRRIPCMVERRIHSLHYTRECFLAESTLAILGDSWLSCWWIILGRKNFSRHSVLVSDIRTPSW